MADRARILFVVEGRHTERTLVERMTKVFGVSADIYSVNANIYSLYQTVKDDPFADTIEVLRQMKNGESDRSVLNGTFSDLFLVFDCDLHHTFSREDVANLTLEERARRNIDIVRAMVARFDESTDPQRGKMFVNYPMVESFRDCDDFYDPQFADAFVSIADCKRYKQLVATKKLVRFHPNDFTRENFADLMRMNLAKARMLCEGAFKPPTASNFEPVTDQRAIAGTQSDLLATRSLLAVLNTLLFFPIEYFGNRNSFYDQIAASPDLASFAAKSSRCANPPLRNLQ